MAAFKLTKKETADLQKLSGAFEEARDELSTYLAELRDEWQSAFDDRSEKWQEGDAGSAAQSLLSTLEEWIDKLEDIQNAGAPDAFPE